MRVDVKSAVFFLLLFVLACRVNPAQSAEYPIAGPRDRLTVSYSAVSPSFGALWVAKELGIFDQNGLDTQLIFIQSSPTNIQALINNDIQISVSGAVGVVNSALAGLDLVFVGASISRCYTTLSRQLDQNAERPERKEDRCQQIWSFISLRGRDGPGKIRYGSKEGRHDSSSRE